MSNDAISDTPISIPPTEAKPILPSHLVGLGASAGGLEALERFFRAMPDDSGMAFVVIQHLSPDYKSLMNELLARYTRMQVKVVDESAQLEANTIYILPPRKEMVVEGNTLISREKPRDRGVSLPINVFFRSLVSWGERAVAIILSGTGADGSNALMDIRDAGGIVLAESPATARFTGMPNSAINTGCVDGVMAPEEMPKALATVANNPFLLRETREPGSALEGLPKILDLLKSQYRIDFGHYKPTTILRRIERRLSLEQNPASVQEYAQLLSQEPDELDRLYRDLLIGVTRFFRDNEAFAVLRDKVIPEILERTPPEEEVRVWVCGCSTGEEAYSVGILFLEAFAQLGRTPFIKVLATDLHPASIRAAMEGVYTDNAFVEMANEYRERYFMPMDLHTYKVVPALRRIMVFSEHNVLKDPPFTRLHLLTCRNLLIYLQPPAQHQALANFNFALKPNGVLFLGSSESLGDLIEDFEDVDRQWKFFRKIRENRARHDLQSPTHQLPRFSRVPISNNVALGRMYTALLDRFIPAGYLVNDHGEILHVFGESSQYMQPPSGRITNEVMSLLAEGLNLAVATGLRNAREQKTALTYKGVLVPGFEETLEVTIEPMFDKLSNTSFYMVVVTPQTAQQPLLPIPKEFSVSEELAPHLNRLQEELNRTQESLRSAIEELETSNEELQASNEELLAANEELQSTNEELHSVNEELYSVNAEHEQKLVELQTTTANLNSLLQSSDTATVFLGQNFKIQLFTPRAKEIFNLVPHDLGRDIRDLMPRIADPHLLEDMERVLSEKHPLERQIHDGHRTYLRRCSLYNERVLNLPYVVLNYTDISEVVRIGDQLQSSERNYAFLAEAAPVGIFRTNLQGELTYINRLWTQISGVKEEQALGHGWKQAILPEDAAQVEAGWNEALQQGKAFDMEFRFLVDGKIHWVYVQTVPVTDGQHQTTGYIGTVSNITERKNAEEAISRLAFFDTLTGLPNRRMLMDRLGLAVATSKRTHQFGGLMFVDLDHFKTINDSMGHHLGDQILAKVAGRLNQCVRSTDTVARLGGDEFVVLLENLADTTEAAAVHAHSVAEKIRTELGREIELANRSFHLACSIGIALFDGENVTGDDLLKWADLAMYQAKSSGRNSIRFFDPLMQASVNARAQLEANLHRAVRNHEFVLRYQPRVNHSGQVTGFEALVRWQTPEGIEVLPDDFIHVAEESNLILNIGKQVLDMACQQLATWQGKNPDLTVAINVSLRQFRNPKFAKEVVHSLEASGADPKGLVIELTESLLASSAEDVALTMQNLKQQGIQFALDDFGTGYSSLAYLKALPFDQVKIDRSFIRDICMDTNDASLVRAMIVMAHSLGLYAVAEGVESAEQWDFLQQESCDEGQGFLFGQPRLEGDIQL